MSALLSVELGERSYPIAVGDRDYLVSATSEWLPSGCRVLIVSDGNVAPLYGDSWLRGLQERDCRVAMQVVPAGETSKCREELFNLYDAALAAGLDRDGVICALGGGVVGDLAGFAAATFLRGIALVQAPTSLLAMVDSSVGGKTGINLPGGKNLVGAFHQPLGVSVDASCLATLPERELRSGLAEVVKYGCIGQPGLLDILERRCSEVLTCDVDVVERIVVRCCRQKAAVVHEDERESGARASLNLGHTLGHALERCGAFSGYTHGEAVSLGMVFALRLSNRVLGLPEASLERIVNLLHVLGLPVARPSLDWSTIRAAISTDKKASGGVPRWVLCPSVGRVQWQVVVEESVLSDCWDSWPEEDASGE